MQFPHKNGRYTDQAHVNVPAGTFELEHGRDGFFSEQVSHLYLTEPPSHWKRVEGDLQPRAIDARRIETADSTNPNAVPTELMQAAVWCGKKTFSVFLSKRTEAMPYIYRSADGDEMYFVHDGYGRIETEYGVLEYERGDYIYLPRGTMYRVLPANDRTFMIINESRSPYQVPDRGLLGPHAIFDMGVLRLPDFYAPREAWRQDEYELRVKRLGRFTRVFYDFNPLTAVAGWKGTLTPYILNVRDIRPTSFVNYHTAPTANTTFQSEDVLVTTFAPNRALGDEHTLRVPFYHRNVDFDEFIFYHEGNFFSRAGIEPGMISLHPAGLDHGPHPAAFERDRLAMEEAKQRGTVPMSKATAINLDTPHALFPTQTAIDAEMPGYNTSWYDQAAQMALDGKPFAPPF